MNFFKLTGFLIALTLSLGTQVRAEEMSVLQARVLTIDTVGMLLLYHNPNHSSSLAMQRAYERNIAKLDAWVGANSNRPAKDWQRFVSSVETMESKSQFDIESDSQWIGAFLSGFGKFDDALLAIQAEQGGSNLDNTIDNLDLMIARQNYLYQKVLFSSTTNMNLGVDKTVMPSLDRSVRQTIDMLGGLVGDDRVLQKLIQRYEYIRPKLMDYEGEWFPSVVAFYSSSIRDLLSKIQNRHEFKAGQLSQVKSFSRG